LREYTGEVDRLRLFSPLRISAEAALLLGEGRSGIVDSNVRYSMPIVSYQTVLYTLFCGFTWFSKSEIIGMPRLGQQDNERIADNLRRTIELTELGLALRQSVLVQQGGSKDDAMAQVMRDIRRAKELAWRHSPS
jgi:hypothetical protein